MVPEIWVFWLWLFPITAHRHEYLVCQQYVCTALPGVSLAVLQESSVTHTSCGTASLPARGVVASRDARRQPELLVLRVASGSPANSHLLGHFCHTPLPLPMSLPVLTIAVGTPSALRPDWGAFGPSLLALCQGWISLCKGDSVGFQALCWNKKYPNRPGNLIQKAYKVAGIFGHIPKKPLSPFPECGTVGLHNAQ